jgi:hypothetical protein
MNRKLAEIDFDLTKTPKEERKVFVKCTVPQILPAQEAVWFACAAVSAYSH